LNIFAKEAKVQNLKLHILTIKIIAFRLGISTDFARDEEYFILELRI